MKMKWGQRSSRFLMTSIRDGAGSKLTYVGILVVFDDLPEFKVTRHDRHLQTQVRGTWKSLMDPQFSSYVVILLNCWSSYAAAAPPHKCPHLPERVSDRVCFWPPCLPPCTEGHGHSFPDQSEKVNRFRKDHSGYFMWHLFPLPYLVVQGRNVKCGVP